MCGSADLSVALCGSVDLSVASRGSVDLSVAPRGSAHLSVALRGSVDLSVASCGSVDGNRVSQMPNICCRVSAVRSRKCNLRIRSAKKWVDRSGRSDVYPFSLLAGRSVGEF